MEVSLDRIFEILERTPDVLRSLTAGISDDLAFSNEGENTWNVCEVLGHLAHLEETAWPERIGQIMADDGDRRFAEVDRVHRHKSDTIREPLERFAELRVANLNYVRGLELQTDHLLRTGIHPTFGPVTLGNLLSTWAVHDFDHISQITRIIAKQFKPAVGRWSEFLRIVRDV